MKKILFILLALVTIKIYATEIKSNIKEGVNVKNVIEKTVQPPCCTGTAFSVLQYRICPSPCTYTAFLTGTSLNTPSTPFRVGNSLEFNTCYKCNVGCQCSMKIKVYRDAACTIVAANFPAYSGACCTPIKFKIMQPIGHYFIKIQAFCNGSVCATSINDFYTN